MKKFIHKGQGRGCLGGPIWEAGQQQCWAVGPAEPWPGSYEEQLELKHQQFGRILQYEAIMSQEVRQTTHHPKDKKEAKEQQWSGNPPPQI